VQFSEDEYMVDESAGYASLKVIVSGQRHLPISFTYNVFVSNTKFQPYPGMTVQQYIIHSLCRFGLATLIFWL